MTSTLYFMSIYMTKSVPKKKKKILAVAELTFRRKTLKHVEPGFIFLEFGAYVHIYNLTYQKKVWLVFELHGPLSFSLGSHAKCTAIYSIESSWKMWFWKWHKRASMLWRYLFSSNFKRRIKTSFRVSTHLVKPGKWDIFESGNSKIL